MSGKKSFLWQSFWKLSSWKSCSCYDETIEIATALAPDKQREVNCLGVESLMNPTGYGDEPSKTLVLPVPVAYGLQW